MPYQWQILPIITLILRLSEKDTKNSSRSRIQWELTLSMKKQQGSGNNTKTEAIIWQLYTDMPLPDMSLPVSQGFPGAVFYE